MISFDAAEKIVRNVPPALETERISLSASLFSVLAEDIIADMNMPPFNKSAVDGFACRFEDLGKPLHCIETIAAGSTPKNLITQGTCARIMTGAGVPGGANCVIMLEDTQIDEKGNIIFTAQKTAVNICNLAEDVHKGEKLLSSGTILKPRHIPVLASMGYTHPLVYKKPTVGIISTGSELVDPSQKPAAGKIRNSNGPQLEAQCTEMHIQTENFGIVPDSRDELRRVILLSISKHPVSIISGGVSVGDFDYAPEIIRELGFEIHFHGLKVKPGKRILFASKDKSYIFGLPGNPVSALVQFEMLVKPMLMKLQNADTILEMEKIILAEEYSVKNNSRMSFVPVFIHSDGTVKAVEYHGSAHIFAFAAANGFMKIPEGINKIEKGAFVDVRLI
jgi:molybdopterin molybdotransferase